MSFIFHGSEINNGRLSLALFKHGRIGKKSQFNTSILHLVVDRFMANVSIHVFDKINHRYTKCFLFFFVIYSDTDYSFVLIYILSAS